jgi:hypothetical protein
MIKRGWLPGVEDVLQTAKVEAALVEFFGVQSMTDVLRLCADPSLDS